MYRINFPHMLGILFIIAGLILIFSADISVKPDNIKSLLSAITGGLCLIVAVPCFYMPYSEYSLQLFRRKRKNDNITERAEAEFDYPDDDFDYILDEETRKILIEFRDEQRKKYSRK